MTHPDVTPLAEARKKILSRLTPLEKREQIAVMEARQRYAAQSLSSTADLPPTDNAAVDGFGVHAGFLEKHPNHEFKVIGSARAGHPFEGTIPAGNAVRIFTGAIMPNGPDCVFMHEDCDEKNGFVRCSLPPKKGLNIRSKGENLITGEALLSAGQKITSADIGQLSAAGIAEISVSQRLRIGVLSTGDELAPAGKTLTHGRIFDSNAPMLSALVKADGHLVQQGGIISDKRATLASAYGHALDTCDVVLSSGGASDGHEDHTQGALADIGAECIVWRLAIKPGRPMAVAVRGQQLICCLPGNPVAAFVCYKMLVSALLDRLAGGHPRSVFSLRVPAGFSMTKSAGRAEFLRARIDTNLDGTSVICLHGRKGAGVISSLTGADGLVELPLEVETILAGQLLSFMPFQEVTL